MSLVAWLRVESGEIDQTLFLSLSKSHGVESFHFELIYTAAIYGSAVAFTFKLLTSTLHSSQELPLRLPSGISWAASFLAQRPQYVQGSVVARLARTQRALWTICACFFQVASLHFT